MITASNLFDSIRSALDDDRSGMYSEADDLSPAVNAAIDYVVAAFTSIFESKKVSPEALRDLTTVGILPVTGTSTKIVDVSSLEPFWTILGVDPDPVVTGNPEILESTRRRWATKLTLESWNDAAEDPFSAGTVQAVPPAFARAAYIGPGVYFGGTKPYLMVRPGSVFTADKVAIWYLKYPARVTGEASIVQLPQTLQSFLLQKALNYLSLQHGPESKYSVLTEKDLNQLITMFAS